MAEQTPAKAEPRFAPGHESEGRPAALIAWGLYILSLPSANLLVIVGLIVAYAGRSGSDGLSRARPCSDSAEAKPISASSSSGLRGSPGSAIADPSTRSQV